MAMDDGVDVVDMDEEAPDVDGYLEMAPVDKKKPDWKPFWFLLHGSSLFYYKTELEAKAKGVIQLHGAAELATGSDATVVIVREATKKGGGWQLKASKAEKAQWWASQLTAARDRKPREMPDRDAIAASMSGHAKTTISYRAKKAFGSKFAATRFGAGTLSSISEETDRLVSSIGLLIAAESGSKQKAAFCQRGATKLVVKALIEIDRGSMSRKEILDIDKPLRRCFNAIEQLFKNYKRIPAVQMKDLFGEMETLWKDVMDRIARLLRPFLRAKSMLLIQNLSEYMLSAAFWMNIWDLPDPDGSIERALFDVVTVMVHYTEVEYNLG